MANKDGAPSLGGQAGASEEMKHMPTASKPSFNPTTGNQAVASQEQALAFLRAIYGEDAPGWLPVFLLPGRVTHWVRACDLARAADVAVQAAERGQNVYVPVGLQRDQLESGRGTAETVCALVGLWADIDVQNPAHASADLPPDDAAALALVRELPLVPTVLVHSGHGLQAWWCFRELWMLDSDMERQAAAELARQWQATLQGIAARHGWRLDATADLARVLRLPGTVNWKLPDKPAPVRLLSLSDGTRYNPADFEPFLLFEDAAHTERDNGHRQAAPLPPVIPDGQRNVALASLAGSMRRRGATREAIEAALLEQNRTCETPLDDAEVRRIARSVSRYDPVASPNQIASNVLNTLHLTDAGNAEAFVMLYGDRFRYCHNWGKWLAWDGRRWLPDADGEADRAALATAKERIRAAADLDGDAQKKAISWALRSESRALRSAMLGTANIMRPITITAEILDTDPWLLTVRNGTLDLRNGELRPHNPGDLLTKLVDVDYDPSATCPRWLRFLAEVFEPVPDVIPFVQRAIGYSLTGDTREDVFFLLHGTGRNGKTTFLDLLRDLLGDHAKEADFATLSTQRDNAAIRNDLAALAGKRLVTANEPTKGIRFSEGIIKRLTGGDPVTARFLYHEEFTYIPTFKVWLAANHKPTVRETTIAFWERVKLIPFLVNFTGREDKVLPDKLREELPGILTWAVEGCLAWQRDGLGEPPSIRSATSAYREEMDLVAQFIEERCTEEPGAEARGGELYKAFKEWCEERGEKPERANEFAADLLQRGYAKNRATRGVVYRGIRLAV